MSERPPHDSRALAFALEQLLLDLVMDTLSGASARRLPEVPSYVARILLMIDGMKTDMTSNVTDIDQPG